MRHSTGFLLFCLLFASFFAFWLGGWRQGIMYRAKEKVYLIERSARMDMVIKVGRDRDKKMNEIVKLKRDLQCPK